MRYASFLLLVLIHANAMASAARDTGGMPGLSFFGGLMIGVGFFVMGRNLDRMLNQMRNSE